MSTMEVVLGGKFEESTGYTRKLEKPHVNNLIMHLKALENQE